MSKFKFSDWDKSLIALGAAKERRRIRRALHGVLGDLWQVRLRQGEDAGKRLEIAWNTIDNATRARKPRRGK